MPHNRKFPEKKQVRYSMHFLKTVTVFALAVWCAPASRSSLVLWYPLDQGSGTEVTDASGNGGNITWNGNGTWNATGPFGGSLTLGASGSLLARTNTANDNTIALLNAQTSAEASITFWAKANVESQGSSVFYIGNSSTNAGNRVFNSHLEWTTGETFFDVDWGDGSDNRTSGNFGLSADQMHHYAMIYNGTAGTIAIYKDGGVASSANFAPDTSLPWSSISNFEFGAASFDTWWGGGQLDDIAIWNHALSPEDVTTIFTQGVSGLAVPEPSSLAYSLSGLLLVAWFRARMR